MLSSPRRTRKSRGSTTGRCTTTGYIGSAEITGIQGNTSSAFSILLWLSRLSVRTLIPEHQPFKGGLRITSPTSCLIKIPLKPLGGPDSDDGPKMSLSFKNEWELDLLVFEAL